MGKALTTTLLAAGVLAAVGCAGISKPPLEVSAPEAVSQPLAEPDQVEEDEVPEPAKESSPQVSVRASEISNPRAWHCEIAVSIDKFEGWGSTELAATKAAVAECKLKKSAKRCGPPRCILTP